MLHNQDQQYLKPLDDDQNDVYCYMYIQLVIVNPAEALNPQLY